MSFKLDPKQTQPSLQTNYLTTKIQVTWTLELSFLLNIGTIKTINKG